MRGYCSSEVAPTLTLFGSAMYCVQPVTVLLSDRVTTNLEYWGFSEHGKLGEFCAISEENCNRQSNT